LDFKKVGDIMNFIKKSIKRKIARVLYYSLAFKLPETLKGQKIRYILARQMCSEIGKNVQIRPGAIIGNGSNLQIGDYSKIGINCRIQCGSLLKIGDYVAIASDVQIIDVNHNFERTDIPIMKQGWNKPKSIVIEDDVWVGARCIILPGVKIGKGSIIGAGSVVTKSVPPYSIVGGNPAKVIKSRL
jgi:maltose O-acetyltransferase